MSIYIYTVESFIYEPTEDDFPQLARLFVSLSERDARNYFKWFVPKQLDDDVVSYSITLSRILLDNPDPETEDLDTRTFIEKEKAKKEKTVEKADEKDEDE